MADVVHDVHVEVVGRPAENLGEGLARQEGHAAAVDPRVVGGRRHRGEVVLACLLVLVLVVVFCCVL